MRKWVIFAFIIIFIIAIFTGVYIYDTSNEEEKIALNYNETILQNEEENVYTPKNEITINTSITAEKISPNAVLTLKKAYNGCAHTIKEYKEIPEEFVNLTKEELKEKYSEYEIERFSALDVILMKQEEGVCNEHYILKEKDGFIAIYKIENDDVENLEELTGISMEYLTDTDRQEIQKGIKVYGMEELNSILENYE